jgi:hypothetical protein
VLKVFYNEFEFEPADFSIPLLFLFSFLIILSAAFVLYILVKYRILGKLRAIKFFDNIMSEFNEEDVGNNLVLEVIDYKRHKKPKTERNTQQPETAVSQNESATDLHESTG